MPVMYSQQGSQGNRGGRGGGPSKRGGGGASKRGGGGGGSRRDGDVLLSPNSRGNIDGYGGGSQRTDKHREEDSSLDKQCHGGTHAVQIEKKEEMEMEGREEDLTPKKIRIHVGGLGESVTSDDLCGTFSKLGVEIEAVDIIRTKGRSFAYIDFSHNSLDALPKLFNTYNGCAWKGGRLRLEKAKENYLDCMKREWDEDAELARNKSTTNVDLITYYTEPAEKLKKGIASEQQLRVFFPRLRKIKSLPFTGTGKHKYSFRRVEVPLLPTYFCDCEEHSGSLYRVGEKQIPALENEGGGMNKEEIDLMNSVMHKLFEKENVSSSACNDVELTKEEDEPVEEIDDLEVDESEGTDNDDNLIINVVTRGKGTTLTRPNQDSKINKRIASNDMPTHLPLKKKARNSEKKKANESVPMVSGGEGENIESESSVKQLGSSVSWSQKSSWRELIGDKSNSTIISNILLSTSLKKKKKKKKAKQQKLSTLPNSSDSENEKSLMNEYQRDHLDKKEEDTVEVEPAKMDFPSEKGGRDENEESLMDKYQRDNLDKEVEDNTEAQPTKMDSDSEKVGRDENNESLMPEYQKDQLYKKVEDTKEAQPIKPVSSKTGRGSTWLHKSSWTELVANSSTNSFSIRQILPDIAFDKLEPVKTDVPITNSGGNKDDDDIIEKKENDSGNGASGSRIKSDIDVQKSTEANQISSIGDKNASVPMKQSLCRNVEDLENFSFKRTDESLKEWKTLKAALSAKRKRTSKKE